MYLDKNIFMKATMLYNEYTLMEYFEGKKEKAGSQV